MAYAPLHDYHERHQPRQTSQEQKSGDSIAVLAGKLSRSIEDHHDLWIVLETLALVAFTGTLWWSTRRLWLASERHAGHMEKSAAAAEIAAEAAKAAADAAVAQTTKMGEWTDIAEKQMLIIGRQTDIQEKQHAVSRMQFIADKRPKIRVRNIVVRTNGGRPFFPREFVSGQCYMANVGGTDAKITETLCEVFWTNGPLPMERPYEGRDGLKSTAVLAAGQSSPLSFQSDEPIDVFTASGIMTGVGAWIYVLGWVEYEDIQGVRRRTAFCRRYDHARGRFVEINDPDYEHEE